MALKDSILLIIVKKQIIKEERMIHLPLNLHEVCGKRYKSFPHTIIALYDNAYMTGV